MSKTSMEVVRRDNYTSLKEVVPNLWLGSLSAVRLLHVKDDDDDGSNDNGSTSIVGPDVHWTVISILDSPKIIFFPKLLLQKRVKKGICTHTIWKLPDKSNGEFLSEKLKNILNIIDEVVVLKQQQQQEQRQCLVHCARGVSRSVATLAAWYISRQGTSLAEAMDVIRRVRPEGMPNIGFIACLRALEQCEGDVDKARSRLSKRGDESTTPISQQQQE